MHSHSYHPWEQDFSFLLSLAHKVHLSSVQKQPPFLDSSACFSSLLLFLLIFSFLLLLLLRVEQFVCLGVHWVLHSLNFLFDLIGRVEASAAQFAVDAFGVSIPVVARHADHVARLQGNVFTVAWLVGVDGDLVVGILTSKVVNIIQGVEEGGGIWVQRLHDLICHTADLPKKQK